jgi:hypothetical protein
MQVHTVTQSITLNLQSLLYYQIKMEPGTKEILLNITLLLLKVSCDLYRMKIYRRSKTLPTYFLKATSSTQKQKQTQVQNNSCFITPKFMAFLFTLMLHVSLLITCPIIS